MARSRGVLENRLRTEARIFAAGRPGEVAQRLEALRAQDGVNPVADFEPADEREHFVRGQVEGMQHQSELVVSDERKEVDDPRSRTTRT